MLIGEVVVKERKFAPNNAIKSRKLFPSDQPHLLHIFEGKINMCLLAQIACQENNDSWFGDDSYFYIVIFFCNQTNAIWINSLATLCTPSL